MTLLRCAADDAGETDSEGLSKPHLSEGALTRRTFKKHGRTLKIQGRRCEEKMSRCYLTRCFSLMLTDLQSGNVKSDLCC